MNFSTTFKSLLILLSVISVPSVSAHWKPTAGTKWNWCLGENPNKITIPNGEYKVIDIDLESVKVDTIKKFHDQGLKVICYFSAGTYEPFREASQGMLKVKGLVQNKMSGWDENWLDYRVEGIKPFMIERLDLAASKGCDGVEFDNVDAYANTKWSNPLTAKDQIKYNSWLAKEAHNRNLSAGLKNCVGLLSELVDNFDFAINESCSAYTECPRYSVFLDQDKAVFVALYGLINDSKFVSKICSQIEDNSLSIIIKDPDQSLKYPYVRFDYNTYCGKSSSKKTTTKKTSTKKSVTTSLPISTNDRCGAEYGRCPSGQCCSKYGWCGEAKNYCGSGCQPFYGICKY